MNLSGKKVLITGAGGFVGSHLVEKLVHHGCKTRCFIRYTSRNDQGMLGDIPEETYTGLEIIAGDLRDSHAVHEAMKGIDVVFHLGALIAIPYSYFHPTEVFQTNVLGTLHVMQSAREHGIEKIVHTSTSEVYGSAQYTPIDEKHPLQAQSPYSASKIAADKLVESFHASYGLPVATIRPFNMYGPRQSARAVIPTIISQTLTQNEIFIGKLNTTRDFTYVCDTAEAFMQVAECDESIGRTMNVGSNTEISIGDLTRMIIDLIGNRVEIIQDDRRFRPENSEVQRLRADSSAASEILGWHPSTSLKDGLKKTIEWISSRLTIYRAREYVI